MADNVEIKADVAVAAMRSAADRSALAALVDLATEEPKTVVECLAGRILEVDPSDCLDDRSPDHLPTAELITAVTDKAQSADFDGLLELGGGTYDGLLALLVAVLAATERIEVRT